jgi:hypothetical protein
MNNRGHTPLHIVLKNGADTVAHALLGVGASIMVTDARGLSVFDLAASARHLCVDSTSPRCATLRSALQRWCAWSIVAGGAT